MKGKFELMERCLGEVQAQDLPDEELIKILRILGSTANKLAEEIEIAKQLKEIDNA
jgi:hypothetical protein